MRGATGKRQTGNDQQQPSQESSRNEPDHTVAGPVKRGCQGRAKTPRLRGQTMLVVLRIARVRTDIGVFLNDPGPRLAETIEKDAFTSLLCPKESQ
jgi:hypothetical protein